MTYDEFTTTVKETVKKQQIPPRYNPREWKNKSFNCYAYALQVCMNIELFDVWPGFIGSEKNDYRDTKSCILKYFYKDCEQLSLQVKSSDLDEVISDNEYKVAIYLKRGKDFHFARQDSDGNWSEKVGWIGGIRKLKQSEVLMNCDDFGYKFIGVYRLSKKEG